MAHQWLKILRSRIDLFGFLNLVQINQSCLDLSGFVRICFPIRISLIPVSNCSKDLTELIFTFHQCNRRQYCKNSHRYLQCGHLEQLSTYAMDLENRYQLSLKNISNCSKSTVVKKKHGFYSEIFCTELTTFLMMIDNFIFDSCSLRSEICRTLKIESVAPIPEQIGTSTMHFPNVSGGPY